MATLLYCPQPRHTSRQLEYDAEAEVVYIRVADTPSSRTEEASDVCMVDCDPAGHVVAIELPSVCGFARASRSAVVRQGLLAQQDAARLVPDLRHARFMA